jgi:hypothetical protein
VIPSGTTIAPDSEWMWSWAFVVHREIEGHPVYCVGSDGTVWSRSRRKSWLLVKAQPQPRSGLLNVGLGRGEKRRVHRLVLSAFLGPRSREVDCCHNDGDPNNNNLYNLRWDTRAGNMADAIRHGTAPRGSRHGFAKLSEKNIAEIFDLRARGWLQKDIAARFGIIQPTVSDILRGKKWKHLIASPKGAA